MTVTAIQTFGTKAQSRKIPAHGRCNIDLHVSVATGWIRTLAVLEMHTGRDFLRSGNMGQIARIASGAYAFSKVGLADGDFGWVVLIRTGGAFEAGSY